MSRKKHYLKFIFITYMITIFSFTLLPVSYPFPVDPKLVEEILSLRIFKHDIMYNLIPFSDLNMLIENLKCASVFSQFIMLIINFFKGFILNIVMFIPLGILLPAIKNNYQQIYKVLVFSLMLSLGIELLQLVEQVFGMTYWRVIDVEDILANVIGALLGFCLFVRIKRRFTIP
ncbi:MAG: VanZ family protein [Syntrophomonadaceae bacterium]|nr:VanZ family protein [Syntrophomonadaceae bacterium]